MDTDIGKGGSTGKTEAQYEAVQLCSSFWNFFGIFLEFFFLEFFGMSFELVLAGKS